MKKKVLAIMLVAMSIMLISACGKKEKLYETEPYGLTVFLKDEPSAVKLEDELQVNADMTFDLIGNLGTIDYKTADSKEIIASYER